MYDLNKPFAMLLPLPTLQGKARFKLFEKGLEMLVFDSRVAYEINGSTQKSTPFASCYFCKNLLPEKLIFKELKKCWQYKSYVVK